MVRALIYIELIFLYTSLFSQEYIVSGLIRNNRTKETLTAVKISVLSLPIETVTNKEGYYSLKLPQGTHAIKLNSYGYQIKEETIEVQDNFVKNFELAELVYQKEEIIITDKRFDENVKSTLMGKTTLRIDQLKTFPTMFGEVDVIKSFLTTPGVTTSNDFVTGFNVRGGGVDQNLVILDDMVLFNPYHFFGFFSSFNSDALKTATLYKTNIPIELGGRVSSVLDVTQKSGNRTQYSATVFLSILDSKIMVEGPLGSEKGSFMIAARRSYFDLSINALKGIAPDFFKNIAITIQKLYFYDINVKLTYSFDSYNEMMISFYAGKDVIAFINEENDKSKSYSLDSYYGNIAGSINWKHIFAEGFYSNLILTATNYTINTFTSSETRKNNYNNGDITILSTDTSSYSLRFVQDIVNIGLKYNFTYLFTNNIVCKFGLEGNGFALVPGASTSTYKYPGSLTQTIKKQFPNRYTTEWSPYIGIEHDITTTFRLDYGIRGNVYFGLGPLKVNEYKNNQPIIYDVATGFPIDGIKTGEKNYGSLELASYYLGIEPRISGRFLVDEETSLKVSYSWLRQNIQMTTIFSYLNFPIDTWYVSDKYLLPQTSHNFSLGVYRNFFDNELEISVEGYFRLLQNLNDYVEGYDPITRSSTIEEQMIYQTDGRAYGVEVYIIKNKGRRNHWTDNFTGTISYTYSRTERKYPEQLRSSVLIPVPLPEYAPLGYDKTHNFNITGSYQLESWTFGISFTYQTNIPKTLPLARYIQSDMYYSSANYYGYSLNNYRLSDYHRLDISIRKDFKILIPEWQRTIEVGIIAGAFNIYNRINTVYGSLQQNNKGIYEYIESGLVPITINLGVEFKI